MIVGPTGFADRLHTGVRKIDKSTFSSQVSGYWCHLLRYEVLGEESVSYREGESKVLYILRQFREMYSEHLNIKSGVLS